MLNPAEQAQLAIFRSMATMNNSQALEFHSLLMKEMAVVEAAKDVVSFDVEFVAEAKPKRKKKK